MKLKIKESSIVRPAEDLPDQRLWVSEMDLLQTRYHLPTVYLYKPNGNGSSNFFDTGVIKEALSKVLVAFYQVAGRMRLDENGRLEVHCNGKGVLFVEAETDCPTSELGDFMPSPELQQLVPSVDYSSHISSYPLLLTQVTKFTCGGVCLGVAMHHILADGASALSFMKSWSTLARGLSLSSTPFIDRTILRGQDPPSPKFHHAEYDPPPKLNNPKSKLDSESHSMANLKICAHQLNTLIAKVNNNESKTKYTPYEILAAHIWRCTCKARGLSDDQVTKLNIPIDGRFRLRPPLPPGYFGNAVFHASPLAQSGDLLSEPFVDTVARIHKAIKRMDDEYLRSALDYLEQIEDITTIMRGRSTCGCPNLVINSWLRLPFHEIDFGWGAPLLMRPTKAFEGKGYICSSPDNGGSLFLAITLGTDHMKSFQKLIYDI